MTVGIYEIVNKETGCKYIGQSVNISQRWTQHKGNFRHHNREANSYLQEDWDRYGESSFEFNIVEEITDYDDLNDKQIKYVLTVLEHKHIKLAMDNGEELYNAQKVTIPDFPGNIPLQYLPEYTVEDLLNELGDLRQRYDILEEKSTDYMLETYDLKRKLYVAESRLKSKHEKVKIVEKEVESRLSTREIMGYEREIWKANQEVKALKKQLDSKDDDIEFWRDQAAYWRTLYQGG